MVTCPVLASLLTLNLIPYPTGTQADSTADGTSLPQKESGCSESPTNSTAIRVRQERGVQGPLPEQHPKRLPLCGRAAVWSFAARVTLRGHLSCVTSATEQLYSRT
jgi:hypothetical protein